MSKAVGRQTVLLNKAKKKLISAEKRKILDEVRVSRWNTKNEQGSASAGSTPFRGTAHRIGDDLEQKYACLDELHKMKRVKPNRRRFSLKLIALSLSLYLISGTAYFFLRDFFPLPSRQTLQNRTSLVFKFDVESMLDLTCVKSIVENYRQTNKETDTQIHGFLAVDAISFDRELIVSKNGTVFGTISSDSVESEDLQELQENFQKLEELWKKKYNAIITDAFVFQFHPLSPVTRPFIVHIRAATQGKATQEEVETLETLSQLLNENDVKVLGYAMDGDSTYRKLHMTYYEEYQNRIRNDHRFVNFSGISQRMIVSDPLHLLKRARYRLLASNVHVGLTNGSGVIRVERLRELLNLPSKVFSNEKFTKMHDDLPIALFSFETLVTLWEHEPTYLSYFLPFSLLNIGLSEEALSLEERVNLFELAFYYILAYRGEVNNTRILLPEHKSPRNTHVRLFPDQLALELCNTLASILSVIYSYNGTIHLNRIGTNPLEHIFGTIRMRSRYKRTYSNMVRSVGHMETLKRMAAILGTCVKVSGRKSYYGRIVSVNMTMSPCVLNMNPRDLAVAAHMSYALPISIAEIDCWNMNYLGMCSAEVFTDCMSGLTSIYRRLHPVPKTVVTNSRSILVTSGRNILCSKSSMKLLKASQSDDTKPQEGCSLSNQNGDLDTK